MNKKEYLKPSMQVIKTLTMRMVCESLTGTVSEGPATGAAKSRSWNDEE